MEAESSLKPATRASSLAFALLSVVLQLPTFNRSIVPMDEGHLAAVALWLQNGKYLYQDLHSGIFPGIYHVTSLLFTLFGNDLVVARYAEVATNTAIVVSLWHIGTRSMGRRAAAVAPLLYLAVIPVSFPVLAMFNYSSFSLAFSVMALLFVVRLLDMNRRGDAVALGVVLAMAVISKQNFGALAFLACGVGLAWNKRGSALEEESWVSVLLPIALSGLAVTSLFVAYFLYTGTFGAFLHSTVIQLGGDQMQSFNNPIPPVLGSHPIDDSRFIFLYSPPILFNKLIHGESVFGAPANTAMLSFAIRLSYGVPLLALAGGAGLLALSSRIRDPQRKRGTRVVVAFALLFFLGIFPSCVWSHLAFVLPPVLLVIGLLIDRIDEALAAARPGSQRTWQFGVAGLVCFATVSGLLASADIARWNDTPLGLERGSLYVARAQAEIYQSANRFIEDCAPEGESIFVAPYMPVIYFLADRMNSTRYDLTIPGNVDADLIVMGLHEAQTRCIIYNPVMYPEFPPFEVLFPKAKRYLDRNYDMTRKVRGGGETWFGLTRKGPIKRVSEGGRE